jgi:hypothetical protein
VSENEVVPVPGESDTFNLKNIRRISDEYPKKYEVQLVDINYKSKEQQKDNSSSHTAHIESSKNFNLNYE